MSRKPLPSREGFLAVNNKISVPSVESQINALIASHPESVRQLNFLKRSIAIHEAQVDENRNRHDIKLQKMYWLEKSSRVFREKKLENELGKLKDLSAKCDELEEKLEATSKSKKKLQDRISMLEGGIIGSRDSKMKFNDNYRQLARENIRLNKVINSLEHELLAKDEALQTYEKARNAPDVKLENYNSKKTAAPPVQENPMNVSEEVRHLTTELKNVVAKIKCLEEKAEKNEAYIKRILEAKELEKAPSKSRRVSALQFLQEFPSPLTQSQVNLID